MSYPLSGHGTPTKILINLIVYVREPKPRRGGTPRVARGQWTDVVRVQGQDSVSLTVRPHLTGVSQKSVVVDLTRGSHSVSCLPLST